MKNKQKSKWLRAMGIALSCAMLVTAAPVGVLADEVPTAESTEVTIVKNGSCGENATYTLNSNGLLTISGKGEINGGAFPGWTEITSVVIGEGITSIGSDAFINCSNLTSIDISANVTTIGDRAFASCGLTSIYIPDSVTTIGEWAFTSCGLTSIYIPDKVTTIGGGAFSACLSLVDITVSDANEYFKAEDGVLYSKSGDTILCYSSAKSGTATIPDGVTAIGDRAFANCINLESIAIPASVTTIGNMAFYYCDGLISIDIPDSVKTIGNMAFDGCSSLKSIEIPASVTTIGNMAFDGCSSLTSIVILNGVKTIGGYAFSDCKSLTSIEIPASVETIGRYAFDGCSSLTSIYYAGTEARWNEIEIDLDAGIPDTVKIYFGSTDPDETPDDGDGEESEDGTGETPDDGDGEESDDGTGETPDDGDGEESEDGTGETPDDGDGEESDDGTGEEPDDGADETPDDGKDETPETPGIPEDDTTGTPDNSEDDTTGTPDNSEDDTTETPDNSEDDTTEDTTPDTPNTSDFCEVVLPADNTSISTDDFAAILEENKTKDVVIKSNNGVSFTFAKGTMSAVEDMENYDFGTTLVSDFANAGNMDSSVTKDNFVARINYDYSGRLPATASIRIYAGADYANQTLYYSQILENGFKFIQSVVVDAEGYATVEQDHCSDYILATEKLDTASPETGDSSNIMLYVMMVVFGTGIAIVGMRRKFHN